MKAHKISFYVFIALIIATLVVFGIFFGVDYDNMQGKYNAPEHTGTLLVFMYSMAALCILVTVIGALGNIISSMGGPKGVNITGVPDKAISVVSVGLLVAIMIGAWSMASTNPLVLPSGKIFDDTTLLVLTDTFIYAIYALMVCAVLGLVVNLSGIFRK